MNIERESLGFILRREKEKGRRRLAELIKLKRGGRKIAYPTQTIISERKRNKKRRKK
jgi:hypothetical protein